MSLLVDFRNGVHLSAGKHLPAAREVAFNYSDRLRRVSAAKPKDGLGVDAATKPPKYS